MPKAIYQEKGIIRICRDCNRRVLDHKRCRVCLESLCTGNGCGHQREFGGHIVVLCNTHILTYRHKRYHVYL